MKKLDQDEKAFLLAVIMGVSVVGAVLSPLCAIALWVAAQAYRVFVGG